MSLTVIDGLPAHVLLVHFVVVLVPLTALAVVVCAVWPSWARRLGWVLPVMGLVSLALVPVTTHAGEWLKKRVGGDLVRKHADLGDTLLPWAIGLFLVSAGVWWLGRRDGGTGTAVGTPATAGASVSAVSGAAWLSTTWFRVLSVAVAVIVAAGATVDLYRIGQSGAKAAWSGTATSTSNQGEGQSR